MNALLILIFSLLFNLITTNGLSFGETGPDQDRSPMQVWTPCKIQPGELCYLRFWSDQVFRTSHTHLMCFFFLTAAEDWGRAWVCCNLCRSKIPSSSRALLIMNLWQFLLVMLRPCSVWDFELFCVIMKWIGRNNFGSSTGMGPFSLLKDRDKKDHCFALCWNSLLYFICMKWDHKWVCYFLISSASLFSSYFILKMLS